MAKTVSDMLREVASVYEQRNKLYGDNYKNFGYAMAAMFPKGLQLTSKDDFNRFGIFVQMLAKMTRYGQQFVNGGHEDSLIDLSVYATMLRELDIEAQEIPF